MGVRGFAVALALPLSLAFTVDAQQPADGCTRECWPHDADLNGPGARPQPPVDVVLYAYPRTAGNLVTDRHVALSVIVPLNRADSVVEPAALSATDPLLVGQLGGRAGTFDDLDSAGPLQGAGSVRPLRLAAEPVFYVYVSVDSTRTLPAAGGASPRVELDARVTTTSPGGDALLAAGSSSAALLYSGIDGRPVYEFRVPLHLSATTWPADAEAGGSTRLLVHARHSIDGSTVDPAPTLRVHLGETFPTRLILPIENPIEVLGFHVSQFEGEHYARLTIQSPFGAVDVSDAVDLRLDGPAWMAPDTAHLVAIKRGVAHDWHSRPVNVTWRLDLADADAKWGVYNVTASFRNLQDTYEGSASFTYLYGGPDAVSVPGPGLAAVLVGAVMAPAVFRRRPKA